MRSFLIAGLFTVLFAVGSTALILYNQDQLGQKALQQRVIDRTADWQKLITVYDHALSVQRQAAEALTRGQITAVHDLISAPLADDVLEEKREDILTRLSEQSVGKTGYVWIIDTEGNYILSKDRARDGENILESQDSRGFYPTLEIISDAITLADGEIGTYTYYWQNSDDASEREKVSSYIYFPDLDWIVGAGAYYDDLENATDALSLDKLEDMLADQELGPSGYFIARTSDGIYQVSKDRVRDGENIWDVQDADGNYVVQEHTQTALENPEGGTFSEYYWQNNDDPAPRKKVASYAYVDSLDWVIGATAYYDDKPAIPTNALSLFLISLLGSSILFFSFAFLIRSKKTATTHNHDA